MKTGETAFLGFSHSDILVDCTKVSARPIFPISQPTFFGTNFIALKNFLQVYNELLELVHHIFLHFPRPLMQSL